MNFGTSYICFLNIYLFLRISRKCGEFKKPLCTDSCQKSDVHHNDDAFTSLHVILCQEQQQVSKLREKIINFNPEFSQKILMFDLHISIDVEQLFPVLLHLILQNILHCSLPSSKFDPPFKIKINLICVQ